MPSGELRRYLDFDDVELIAGMSALEVGHPESLEAHYLVVLGASGNLDHRIALQRRDFDFPPEGGGDEIDRHVAGDVHAFSLENRVGLDGDRYVEVTGRTAVGAMLTLVGEAQAHAGFNPGRDMNGDRAFTIDPLPALAGSAGFRDNLAGPFALSAGAADAEKSLLEAKLPGAFTAGAGLDRGGRLGPGPFALSAGLPAGNFQLGFFPVDRFLEAEL